MEKGKARPHRLLSEIQDFQEGTTAYVAGIAKDPRGRNVKNFSSQEKIFAFLQWDLLLRRTL